MIINACAMKPLILENHSLLNLQLIYFPMLFSGIYCDIGAGFDYVRMDESWGIIETENKQQG